ncbi:Ig-like domain repeat protein [Mesorhizobium comanense]|uniref:Ig-like domain repeat protein n=1 Tax=Mesorhizobium comanense TaxID=2502215 RepID=UPI0010F8549E|nr:Ig-like domain repeat protein [Mesorhizobium comanense]
MARGLKAAWNIRALFQGCRRSTGAGKWLERLFVILGATFLTLPARTSSDSDRIGAGAEPRSSKLSVLAAPAEFLAGLASLSGNILRKAHAVVLALLAMLILLAPTAARAADGDGCTYIRDNPAYYDNGAYVVSGSLVTHPAPFGAPAGTVSYAAGTVLYYAYSVSDPSIQARLVYLPPSGPAVDIVPATSTGGSGSYTLPADARIVTPSGTVPGSGGGTVTWTIYCGVHATQAVASTTGTVGTAVSFTPVTASFGRGTYSYGLSGGTLPAGLSFNTGTGAITGTPTAALATTTFTVTVTDQGSGSASQTFQLTVNASVPTVTAISPTSGPTGGGNMVTITGTGFSTAATPGAVLFGASSAASYTIVSDTQITATAPSGSAGTVDITVTTPGGTSATGQADRYTYVAAPTIGTASPASGPTAGGTGVTLTGTNLADATLTVGGASVTPTSNTATTITFTTPAHAAGAVSLVVTTAGGSASTGFTYVAPPVASSFTAPAVAYGAPGMIVSLAGHVTNSPTSYAVGSATTAQGGSVSVDSNGQATYTAPSRFRGNDSFTFTATNLGGTSSPATVTVPVGNPTLSSTLAGSGTRGTALSGVRIDTSGGASPYTCSTTLASGALPAGTQLNSDCTISGTPAASGNFTFTTNVTDSSVGTGPFTQATGSLTLSIAAPVIGLSPAAGTLPAGTVGTGYSQSFTASGGTANYTYARTGGVLPTGLTLAGDTVSGTPTSKGSFDFDITATDSSTAGSGGPYTRTESYRIDIGLGSQTISFDPLSDISLSSTPPPLSATASSGLTVSFASTTPTICTVSGTTITLVDRGLCSITASQAGDDDWGAAIDVVQSFTVTPANLVLTSGAATGLTVGMPYSQTNAASGGVSPYTYTLRAGAFVPGTGLDSGTGTVSGTPTVAGTFSYMVTVADSQGPPATTTTPVITVTIAKGSQTIGFTSAAPTDASVGGTPYMISAASNAPAGAGLTVSYSRDSSSTGCDLTGNTVTFTGTGTCRINADQAGDANWNAASQIQQSFAVGQATPTLAVSASDSNPVLGSPVTLTAELTGSASPTGIVTFKDGSTMLGTGTISGTTATYSTSALAVGAHTITAEYAGDANNAAATSAATTVTVGKATPALGVSASDSNPVLGSSVTLTAMLTGGASPSGTVTFKDGSTTLGTGTISGTAATYTTSALSIGAHTITAEYIGDADNAATTSAAVTVTVKQAVVFTFSPAAGALKEAMAGEDYSQPISATGSAGVLTYDLVSGALPDGMTLLPSGELTGPLDADAEVRGYSFTIEVRDGDGATGTASYTLDVKTRGVTVTDKSIDVSAGGSPGNVNLQAGATGGPFTSADLVFVEPANGGTASIVMGEFAALGPTPLGWYLKFVPNPTYSGTVKVGFTLTSALGTSNTGTVTYKLGYDAAEVTEEIDSLVHGFVRSRQSMISSTIKVPGLLERRRMEDATDPITARMAPSETGVTGSFSMSLAQLESARDNADGALGSHSRPFNIWIDGTFMLHNREQNDNHWGSFGMVSLGADYLLSEKALFGLSFHYDHMTDPTDEDAKLTGNGWLAGPYASFEIGKGVFWDTSLLYGGSANAIDTAFWDGSFDTRRWMVDTSVAGRWQLDGDTVLTPRLRALYFSERVDDYSVKNATGDTVSLEGFDEEQFRVSLGAEVARSFLLENDMVLAPKLGLTGGFSGLDGSGAFGSISAGLSLQTQNAWTIDLGLLLNIEGDGQKSVGAKAGVNNKF